MNHSRNIIRIKGVYNALHDLKDQVVFVGGAVVSLYADRDWDEVRETDDVDILVEIYTHPQYSKLEEKLRSLGFVNDASSGFVGRYKTAGIIVDVMGLDEKILGFANRWYKEAFSNSIEHKIDELTTVRIFTAPYFLAAKLDAFKSRGRNELGEYDGRLSDDFHDIVFLLVYRSAIWEEINSLPKGELKEFLLKEFAELLRNPFLEEWVDAHASYHTPVYENIILPKMRRLSGK